MMWTRRTFLRAGMASTLGGLATGLWTWRVEPHWTEFHERPLPIPGLPADLEGRTLVQLSDLHVGARVDSDYLVGVLEAVRDLAPDFVVGTGDYVSYSDAGELEELRRVFRSWPLGRRATFAVLGNHDYGDGWSQSGVGSAISGIARDAGVRVLRNEATEVGGLHFVGLDDYWGPRFEPERVLDDWERERATVVLCHNPDAADLPVWSKVAGWILSGHTHGGQCKPPFLPPPILPVSNRSYTAGEFLLRDGLRMYINRGLGHLLRVRFNVRPEVTIFRLRRAPV